MNRNLRPPKLYFYSDGQLLKSLKRGVLPVSKPIEWLTPFIQFDRWSKKQTLQVTEEEFHAELRHEYQRLPENIRLLLSFEDFESQSARFEASIRQSVLNRRQDNVKPSYDLTRLSATRALRLWPSAVLEYGWQYQANDYTGLCLGLSANSRLFQSTSQKPSVLSAVSYGAEHDPRVRSAMPLPGLFHDVPENEARGEWRYAVPAKSVSNDELKLPSSSVQEIYYSVKADAELIGELKKLIKLDLRYRQVTLLQVVPDELKWRLTVRPAT